MATAPCLSTTDLRTPLLKLIWLTEAKSGIFDQKGGTRPQKAGRMVTLRRHEDMT